MTNSKTPQTETLACFSLTRSGPNTTHWMSLAISSKTQQAVFTITWTQRQNNMSDNELTENERPTPDIRLNDWK